VFGGHAATPFGDTEAAVYEQLLAVIQEDALRKSRNVVQGTCPECLAERQFPTRDEFFVTEDSCRAD
jgi:hypothetical protein